MLPRVLEPEVMDTTEEARSYDAMDHSEPNAAFVARLVELGACGRMLDLGTGPGHIPILACQRIRVCTVVGVDLSKHMLEIARRKVAAARLTKRISFKLADAKGLPFDDAEFDTVFSNTILHHIPDPRPFLREAWRVLRPGGVFLIRDLYRPATHNRVEKLVKAHTPGADAYQKQLFRQSLEAALTPAELRAAARAAGLTSVAVVIDTDRHMSLQCRLRSPLHTAFSRERVG